MRTVAARAGKTRGGRAPRMTGNEPTTMSDLALSVSDESMEMMPRMAGRSRSRMVGTGFVALVLLGGAGAAAMWKMGTGRPEAEPGVSAGAPPVVTAPPAANPALPAPTPLGAPPPRPSLTTAPQATPEPPRSPTGQVAPPPVAGARPAAARPDAGRAGANAVENERVRLWRERERRWGSGRPATGGVAPPPVEIILPPGSSDPGWKPLPAPTEPSPPPAPAEDPGGAPGPAPKPEDPATPPRRRPPPPAEEPPPKEQEIVIPPPPPPAEPAPTP